MVVKEVGAAPAFFIASRSLRTRYRSVMPVLITRSDYEGIILVLRTFAHDNLGTQNARLAADARVYANLLETQIKRPGAYRPAEE